LLQLLEEVAHLGQQLVDLPHRAQVNDVVRLSRQVVACRLLDLISLLSRVRFCTDDAAVSDRVMHRKFLLEVTHFLLVPLNKQSLICFLIDLRRVFDLLHTGGESQR